MNWTLVIERLGGTSKLARICAVKPQAVSQWKRTGIPPARLQYLRLVFPEVFAAEQIQAERERIGLRVAE